MWSDWLIFCDCGFHSVCPLMEKDKRLMETSWWERLTEGETFPTCLGLALMDVAMISKSDGYSPWGGKESDTTERLLFHFQTMVKVMTIMVTSLKKVPCMYCYSQCLIPYSHHWPMPLLVTPRHPQTSLGQSPVGSLLLSPGSWCTRFCCALQETIS